MKYIEQFKDKELLAKIIKECFNKRELLFKLGINPAGGNYKTLDRYIKLHSLDTSHFKGRANGKTGGLNKKDAKELCFYGSGVNSHTLKLRLIRDGYKDYKCEECGVSEWMGVQLPLELDHVDGNRFNNSFENLKILCPNCHAVKTREQRKKNYKKEEVLQLGELLKIDNTNNSRNTLCKVCNKETSNKTFCSKECVDKSKVENKVSKDKLLVLIEEVGFNYTKLSKILNVSDKTVRKWCLSYGITK